MSTSVETSPRLEDYVGAEDMKPNKAPTVIDLINFKKKLVTALTKCKMKDRKLGGHVYKTIQKSGKPTLGYQKPQTTSYSRRHNRRLDK